MSITITGDAALQTEQIKKIPDTSDVIESITKSVKIILENDEFDFFNTKAKYQIEKDIAKTESTINKLIELKVAAVKQGKNLKKQYKQAIAENDKLKNKLISGLE